MHEVDVAADTDAPLGNETGDTDRLEESRWEAYALFGARHYGVTGSCSRSAITAAAKVSSIMNLVKMAWAKEL
jgi:hypothetical protein